MPYLISGCNHWTTEYRLTEPQTHLYYQNTISSQITIHNVGDKFNVDELSPSFLNDTLILNVLHQVHADPELHLIN